MLTITIPQTELFNPETNEFIPTQAVEIRFCHNLLSLSKWERKWKVHFIANQKLTPEQFLDYIKVMTVNGPFDDIVYQSLTKENLESIADYLADPATATTINNRNQSKRGGGRVITSELIYAWMAILRIPFQPCEEWNLNRLLTLIQVTSLEQEPPKKMGKAEALAQQRSLNAARKAKMRTHG